MDERDIVVWAAGFFDGEGCVGVYVLPPSPVRKLHRVTLVVNAANTDRRPLELLKRFGGTHFVSWKSGRPGQRIVYRWQIQGQQAYLFLLAVLPYLVVKKEQAELAIKFWELPWRTKRQGQAAGKAMGVALHRTRAEVEADLEIASAIKAMKRASGDKQ